MKRFSIPNNCGIPALIKALKYRVYANINKQEIIEVSDKKCIFKMPDCRIRSARKRKELSDSPCKPVGLIEYINFAKRLIREYLPSVSVVLRKNIIVLIIMLGRLV